MERLTYERSNGIKTGAWSPNKKQELVDRLAEYERTGLTPKMIEELKKSEVEAQKVAMEHAIELDELKEFISTLPLLATAVPAAVMEPEWIPVEERLPKSGQTVLAFIKHNYVEDGWRAYRVYEYTDHWVGMGNLCDVVAWMPLPEPYRPQQLKEAGEDAAQGGLMQAT